MRYTLLELTQRILESLDSDEVNSLFDSTESTAVVNIIKECYFQIISEIQPRETEGLFHLDASTDDTKPTVMYLPQHASNIEWIKYNTGETVLDTNFHEVCYVELEDFFNTVSGLDLDADWVDTQVIEVDGRPFNFKLRNDKAPSIWTTLDDRVLVFDSYDSSQTNTLTSDRTYCYGGVIPSFPMEDNFIPKLDARQFQLLLNAAKAQAFIELKQAENTKAERVARTHKILAYKEQNNTDTRTERQKQRRKGYGR